MSGVKFATLSIRTDGRGVTARLWLDRPVRIAAVLGVRDKEGFPNVDLYLAGDDAEEVHARLRRALVPEPKGAPALVADRGVRA